MHSESEDPSIEIIIKDTKYNPRHKYALRYMYCFSSFIHELLGQVGFRSCSSTMLDKSIPVPMENAEYITN